MLQESTMNSLETNETEYFSKEIETLKESQMETRELKNITTKTEPWQMGLIAEWR